MIREFLPCVHQIFKSSGFGKSLGYSTGLHEVGNGNCGLQNGDGLSRGYANNYGDGPEVFFPPYREERTGWDPVLFEVHS